MDCSLCKQRISAYVDGELSGYELQQVESHLLICPGCSELLAELTRLNSSIRSSIDSTPVPHGLSSNILARIQGETVSNSRYMMLTGLYLIILLCPAVIVFHPFVSAMAHWLYTTQIVLWHTGQAFLTVIPRLTTVGIAIATVVVIVTGVYLIRVLLAGMPFNEVLSWDNR